MGKKINVLTEYWNRPTDRHTHTQSTLTDSCACAYNETQTYTLWCMFWARRNTRNVCTKRNSIRKWYPDIHTTYLCMQTRTCITRPLMTLETHAFQLSEPFLFFGTSRDRISRQSCKNNTSTRGMQCTVGERLRSVKQVNIKSCEFKKRYRGMVYKERKTR